MKRLLMLSLACTIAGGFAASDAFAARKKVTTVRTAMKRLDDVPPPTPDAISLRVPGPRYQETDIPPAPGTAAKPAPMPAAPAPMEPNYTPVAEAPVAIPMFECVRYLGKHRMAPCAKTKTIVIKDPCQSRCDCCQKCVAINICVPPCACECIKPNKLGNRIVYDYGQHKVIVRILRGRVLVTYL